MDKEKLYRATRLAEDIKKHCANLDNLQCAYKNEYPDVPLWMGEDGERSGTTRDLSMRLHAIYDMPKEYLTEEMVREIVALGIAKAEEALDKTKREFSEL